MKEEFKKIIRGINSTGAKVPYQLCQLEVLTGMSTRALKYKMNGVKTQVVEMLNKYAETKLHHDGKTKRQVMSEDILISPRISGALHYI